MEQLQFRPCLVTVLAKFWPIWETESTQCNHKGGAQESAKDDLKGRPQKSAWNYFWEDSVYKQVNDSVCKLAQFVGVFFLVFSSFSFYYARIYYARIHYADICICIHDACVHPWSWVIWDYLYSSLVILESSRCISFSKLQFFKLLISAQSWCSANIFIFICLRISFLPLPSPPPLQWKQLKKQSKKRPAGYSQPLTHFYQVI